jgi:hypothetical protein
MARKSKVRFQKIPWRTPGQGRQAPDCGMVCAGGGATSSPDRARAHHRLASVELRAARLTGREPETHIRLPRILFSVRTRSAPHWLLLMTKNLPKNTDS